MKNESDVVVITPRSHKTSSNARTPLKRLILPLSATQGEKFFPHRSVWWLEQDHTHAWLRGRGEVAYASIEESLQGNARQLVWELSSSSAERISMPGSPNRHAEVSDLLADILTNERGIRVIPITSELESALQERCAQISESAWSFDWARRHVLRLAEQLHLVSHLPKLQGSLDASWQFARAHFVRVELVSLSGWDPFQVSAAVLSGLSEMPSEWQANIAADDDDMVMRFSELDADDIDGIEQAWQRSSTAPVSIDTLEQSDRRHQLILKSLDMSLRRVGFTPTYNRFVDLRVENPTTEFFCEIKTAHPENFLHQVRLAAGQLLEYRFRRQKQNGDQPLKLVAVVERNASSQDIEFARQFLASLDIALVLWQPETDEFESLYSVFCSK